MRAFCLALLVAAAVAAAAPAAGAATRGYIDSLPHCASTGGVVPLKPANCKQPGGGWKVGEMHVIGPDDYSFGSIQCPRNYPIALAARNGASFYRMSWRDINAAEPDFYIDEQDNTSWYQRTNRYIVNGAGTGALSVGATGEWSSGDRNLNPWSMWIVCHSDGEFGA